MTQFHYINVIRCGAPLAGARLPGRRRRLRDCCLGSTKHIVRRSTHQPLSRRAHLLRPKKCVKRTQFYLSLLHSWSYRIADDVRLDPVPYFVALGRFGHFCWCRTHQILPLDSTVNGQIQKIDCFTFWLLVVCYLA